MLATDSTPALLYYAPPRTGTTSVGNAMRATFRCGLIGEHEHTAVALRGFDESVHFVTVRNPWTRAPSIWRHFAPELTFEQFCRDRYWRTTLLPCWRWIEVMPHVDAVVRVEALREDLGRKFPQLAEKLGHENRAPGPEPVWNGFTVATVLDRFDADFARLGYSRSREEQHELPDVSGLLSR